MKLTQNKMSLLLPMMLISLLLGGCQSTEVTRVSVDEEIALTDKWNDKDSALVADEMIKDMLTFPWINAHLNNFGTVPTIIVQRVRNKSHEHIPTDTFINDLKRSILRSGRAQFVAEADVRKDLRDERMDQELNASSATQKAMGQERGADYALAGSINSSVDEQDGKRVTFYQVDLRLIDLQTNAEVWNGQQKIKKLQVRSRFGM